MDLSIRANTKPTADIIGSMKQLSVVLHVWRLSPLTLVAAPHRGVQILCPLVPISRARALRGGGRGGCGERHAGAAFTPTIALNIILLITSVIQYSEPATTSDIQSLLATTSDVQSLLGLVLG